MEEKKLVPKRRFRGFDGEWVQERLESLATFSKGRGYSKKDIQKFGEPLLLYGSLYTNYQTVINQVDSFTIRQENSVVSKGEEVVVPSSGETKEDIARASVIKKSGIIIGGDLNIIQPSNKLAPSFLALNISNGSTQSELINQAQGSSVVHLYNEDLKNVSIYYPGIKEQQKIGKFFKILDERIANQERKIAKVKALKEAYLTEMFPKEGETVPKRRFAGFKGEWESYELGELIEGHYNGQTPSRFNESHWKGNINWLTSGELNRGVVFKTIEKITEAGKQNANLKVIPKGTFVMAITGLEASGTRGNCAILGIDTTLNQSCMAISPKSKLLQSQFLFHWYCKIGEEYGLKYTQGTKQQSYNAEIINILPIKIPEIKEQKKIGQFFKILDDQIATEEAKLEKLKKTKEAYLEEMFV